jgi:DNA mismatch repair protein MutL
MQKNIIQLLPDSIANQIAAGEVVQRPASVVKELLENAVDAGSTEIAVIIKDAGKSLIQVVDNGVGMSETDARMCFERHATSKIRKSEDLFSVRSYGFRGEAMASIAAVAQVELKTKMAEAECGTLVKIEGSKVKTHEPIATQNGTTVLVKNLFYNVPARRNFLKSNPVELSHIGDEFVRVAMAYPELSFSLHHNDLPVHVLQSGKLAQRITGIFGQNYRERLIPLTEESTDLIKIWGYVGKPEAAKRTRGEQLFFVNRRFIKNGYLHHAITTAYDRLLPADSHPFYVVFMEIDPAHIDINVHPTKTEIKFDDERTIYGLLHAAVKRAINSFFLGGTLSFEGPNALEQLINISKQPSNMPAKTSKLPSNFSSGGGAKERNISGWENAFKNLSFEQVQRDFEQEAYAYPKAPEQEPEFIKRQEGSSSTEETSIEKYQAFFQLHRKYILTQVKTGLMMIRQDLAHERILFERYVKKLSGAQATVQTLLFPFVVEFNAADFVLLHEIEPDIKALGFDFEPFGKSAILIKGVPADVESVDSKELFDHFIEQIKQFRKSLTLPKREITALALAKRAAIKQGKSLSAEEMQSLVDQLFACPTPNYAPDGTPIIAMLSHEELDGMF